MYVNIEASDTSQGGETASTKSRAVRTADRCCSGSACRCTEHALHSQQETPFTGPLLVAGAEFEPATSGL